MEIRLPLSELRPMDAGKKHCTQPSEVVSPSRIPEEGACNMSDRAKPSSHLSHSTASNAGPAAVIHGTPDESTVIFLPRHPWGFPGSHPSTRSNAFQCLELVGFNVLCVIHIFPYILSRFRGAQRTIESTRSSSSAASAADETTARLSL